MGKRYHAEITIINRGQLEFSLEKPKEKFDGAEIYPELYQKAAILMETMTKLHALNDSNKRTAMLTAELMVTLNGGNLVLPLKAVRLSVNTAMDASDTMRSDIQKWFKEHIAMTQHDLTVMRDEKLKEMSTIEHLWESNKKKQADELLDEWLAFDNHPEHKQTRDELYEQWRQQKHMSSG